VWVGIQVLMTTIAITLRQQLIGDHGPLVRLLTIVAVIAVWSVAEYLSQWLLTRAAVARRRLALAAGLTALGRVGITVWSITYLAHSLSEQAEQYGALGVVFSLFTYFLASTLVMLSCTLVAAVLTEPSEPLADSSGRPAAPRSGPPAAGD
jgi:membrane protein